MFTDLSSVAGYYFYEFQFLDDLAFLRDPKDFFEEHGLTDLEGWRATVGAELKKRGWEGDGALSIMWLPPFVGAGANDTLGVYFWVVKQDNNGTAYLGSPDELPFLRLLEQNRDMRVHRDLYPESIARGSRESLEDGVRRELDGLEADLKDCLPNTRTWARVLEHSQAQLILELHEFLDDCYLAVLQEVVMHGNRSKLKLKKIPIDLAPGGYQPDDEDTGSAHEFFTMAGVVSDAWRAYRFLNFPQKADHLFRAVDFTPEPVGIALLRKHVEIRNLFQHHQGMLQGDTLKRLGIARLEIATDGAPLTAQARQRVPLHPKELRLLGEALERLSKAVDAHLEDRVVGRNYAPRKHPSDAAKGSTSG